MRYIFQNGRSYVVDHPDAIGLARMDTDKLVDVLLETSDEWRRKGFPTTAGLLVELAFRLEPATASFEPGEADPVDRYPVLVCGPHTDGNVVAVPVTPETTLVDLMAALEQSVKEAKESRRRHQEQKASEPTEPVFEDVWPIDYDDDDAWDGL